MANNSRGFSDKSKIDEMLSTVKGPVMFRRDKTRKRQVIANMTPKAQKMVVSIIQP